MGAFFKLLKNGNRPALLAAVVNTIIGVLKAVAFFITGNVAMFAEMLHSFGDAANQLFVFIGSALSKRAPTPRFPNGFGRVVNLVCLGAVIIIAIMAYEAVKEGWHHVLHPVESQGFWINFSVLAIGLVLEFFVFYKAGKEVLVEGNIQSKGFLAPVTSSFLHLNRAKPATKLVFLEDLIATSGGALALIAITLAHFFGVLSAEGIASILIGLMMFYVVGRVFLENARGAIGETDEEMLNHIAKLVKKDPDIKDLQRVEVIKEGEFLHVEVVAEVDATHTVSYVDAIRDRLMNTILQQKGVRDVMIAFDQDDGVINWKESRSDKM
ncbi:cation diffusion facilitator family transporter [Sporosarcina sp. HYO08]|uniref:cation diffusion facilitator family transporter n=1 Tax=Sporosarcina sp. HYO08 TaxID=1759557 RepID=UPI00079490FE|nr:cation diffusion facilitator family transporter [Sporosarcina sp. HYO08]KXH79207.1 cation diffusion facilitator family transporter [Sporosarcina sp. HYO08]